MNYNAPRPWGEEPPVDLKPYLKNGIHHRIAEVLWDGIFAPLERLSDRIKRRWTKKFCEENIPSTERI